jgi:hypothetical protein
MLGDLTICGCQCEDLALWRPECHLPRRSSSAATTTAFLRSTITCSRGSARLLRSTRDSTKAWQRSSSAHLLRCRCPLPSGILWEVQGEDTD